MRPARLMVVALPLLLAGCAAPPAFLFASLAFDTAVFASTGKTPTEHVVSAAVRQDCAVRHVFTVGTLCQTDPLMMGGQLEDGHQEAQLDPYSIDLSTLN